MAVPVLQFVTKWAAKMDRSLVRHFISHLLLTSVGSCLGWCLAAMHMYANRP